MNNLLTLQIILCIKQLVHHLSGMLLLDMLLRGDDKKHLQNSSSIQNLYFRFGSEPERNPKETNNTFGCTIFHHIIHTSFLKKKVIIKDLAVCNLCEDLWKWSWKISPVPTWPNNIHETFSLKNCVGPIQGQLIIKETIIIKIKKFYLKYSYEVHFIL